MIFFFKQKTAYEMRISDWSSDVCSSDLPLAPRDELADEEHRRLDIEAREDRRGEIDEVPIAVIDGEHGRGPRERLLVLDMRDEIGRASCRERVCHYV